jgi:hypothetical protein
LIPFMVRQAHHERNQTLAVRPELVEGLVQRFLKPKWVGWARRVCRNPPAVPQALTKKRIVSLRNPWWVTQETLTHPTSACHSVLTPFPSTKRRPTR